jgi:hypothetical protein
MAKGFTNPKILGGLKFIYLFFPPHDNQVSQGEKKNKKT